MLTFERVTKRFGGLVAVEEVSLVCPAGGITSIIGPNGAGKSTLVNLAAGSYRVSSGRVLLDGAELQNLPKHRIARAGLARTYQNLRLYDGMTLLENLEVSLLPSGVDGMLQEAFSWGTSITVRRRRERCRHVLQRFGLAELAQQPAGTLAYGMQKRLELARAVVAEPRAVLLDEPAAGLNQAETAELRDHLNALRAPDRAVVVIEHDMRLVMAISDRIAVLHRGRLLFEGRPAEVRADPEVQEAYLGSPDAHDVLAAAARTRRGALRLRPDAGVAWH